MLADASQRRSKGSRGGEDERDAAPVVWRVEARHAIPSGESLAVAESLHVAILSLAGRYFGVHAIPSVLSGRGADGRPLRGPDQHGHKHVFVGADGAGEISRLAIWAPGGFTREEREVVAGARLRWAGRFVALTVDPGGDHPAFVTARSWLSLTPYLPFNHVKSRGRSSVEGQVRRELVEFRKRGDPATVTVQPWTRGWFRLRRADGRQGGPPPSPLEVRVTFAEPVAGPLVLGRHAHFSLGLMIPDDA
jgi:CRISPR-associated protein Csb2